jgi:hypothetical protein
VADSPTIDLPDLRRRVLEIVEAKSITGLYQDTELLADLARLERANPAAFAGIKSSLSSLKNFRARDFSAALAQHLPPGEAAPKEEKGSDVALLIELGSQGVELFRDHAGKAFARVRADGHSDTYPINNGKYRQWLKNRYYEQTGYTPGAETFRSALDVLELLANRGPVVEVFIRTAEVLDPDDKYGTAYFLDLADDERRAVRITRDGWELVADPPVCFRRPKGMRPLPVPVRGGPAGEFWSFLNVQEGDRPLVEAWMVAALRPRGPFPVLVFGGEQGSAKTSACRVVRGSVDPHVTPLRSLPKDERDLAIAAANSGLLGFDNVSHLPDWVSDALCRLATGSGFASRQLYSDDEEVHLAVCRPCLFNGIEEVAGRSDLLNRAILIELPVIPDDRRKAEEDFWRDFNEAHPRILGTLLDAMVGTLARLPKTRLDRMPRMADFARLGEAGSRAKGRPEGEFLAAYAVNQAKAMEISMESSPVALAIVALMAGRAEWRGTAGSLLVELEDKVQPSSRRRNWPATPRGLSGALRRAAPSLRSLGIVSDFTVAGDRQKTRTITLRSAESPSAD